MPPVVAQTIRVLRIGVVVGVAICVVRRLRRSGRPPTTGTANWPPLADPAPPAQRSGPVHFTEPAPAAPEPAAPGEAAAPEAESRWVAPVDGTCPATHPIKGNAGSGIFHVPGGLSYDRTIPERCYATEADAIADGFRKAKR